MAKKEINANTYNIEDSKGNLNSLNDSWNEYPQRSCCGMALSRGYCARANIEAEMQTYNAFGAMQKLLGNTLTTFNNMGIKLEESDLDAKNIIDSSMR